MSLLVVERVRALYGSGCWAVRGVNTSAGIIDIAHDSANEEGDPSHEIDCHVRGFPIR